MQSPRNRTERINTANIKSHSHEHHAVIIRMAIITAMDAMDMMDSDGITSTAIIRLIMDAADTTMAMMAMMATAATMGIDTQRAPMCPLTVTLMVIAMDIVTMSPIRIDQVSD